MAVRDFSGLTRVAWAFAKQLYLSPANAERLYAEARIISPIKANWKEPFYDVPDPYFCGQPIGRLYIQLAPDVPLRPSSPYYGQAQQLLNLAVIQLCQYADDHQLYDATALEPEAQRLLNEAQRQLQAQLDRNVFLRAAR